MESHTNRKTCFECKNRVSCNARKKLEKVLASLSKKYNISIKEMHCDHFDMKDEYRIKDKYNYNFNTKKI